MGDPVGMTESDRLPVGMTVGSAVLDGVIEGEDDMYKEGWLDTVNGTAVTT